MGEFLEKTYNLFISGRQNLIIIIKSICILLILFAVGGYFLFRNNTVLLLSFYNIGNVMGEFSLITYLLTLLPGMGERFGLKNNILSVLRIYRRYIGILMFTLAIVHVFLVKIIFIVKIVDVIPQGIFEVMGVSALFILIFPFITSNNVSMGKLKIWWHRIQRLTYGAMFFIFFHVSLIRLSVWSVAMGGVIIFQIASFIAIYKKTHSFTGGRPL
jgi:DMSO/TMAO reductase YedYZ heme-binding membrane subunit